MKKDPKDTFKGGLAIGFIVGIAVGYALLSTLIAFN